MPDLCPAQRRPQMSRMFVTRVIANEPAGCNLRAATAPRFQRSVPSPANCSFDGTTKAFLEAKMKNTEIKITEKKTKNTGLVV